MVISKLIQRAQKCWHQSADVAGFVGQIGMFRRPLQFHRLAFLEAPLAGPALLKDLALSFFMRALSAFDICSTSKNSGHS